MTRKLTLKRRIKPTLKAIAQNASHLNRDALLELQTIIEQLLEAPVREEAGAIVNETQQAITEEIEPLALLKQGVDVWNEWREQHPKINLDFKGVDFAGVTLELINLSGVNLELVNLSGASLRGAFLQSANLRGANLYMADLLWVNLQGADLQGANLQGVDLYKANLSNANLFEANLSQANIRRAKLLQANLESANLVEADLL